MSAIREVVQALIAGGMDAVDAAALIAAAVIEGNSKKRSSGAERTARYREREKAKDASQSVTCDSDEMGDVLPFKPSQTVTNRHNVTPTYINEEKNSIVRKRKASRTSLPDNFVLTEALTAYAIGKGIAPDRIPIQFEKFCNYHRAKGSVFADWPAAWRTWVGNIKDFERPAPQAPGSFKWNGFEGVI